MFAIELNMFSIGTIVVPTHTKPIPKPVYIPDIGRAEPIQKQHVKMVGVLVIKLAIPSNTIKHHLCEICFHPKVGEMIIDGILDQK